MPLRVPTVAVAVSANSSTGTSSGSRGALESSARWELPEPYAWTRDPIEIDAGSAG